MTNPKNIDEIINHYNSRVQTVIKRFFSSDEDVQDLKQEVFIKTWKNLNKYQGKSDLWCWLNKITVNVCRDHLRSKKAKTSLNLSGEEELMQNIPDKKTGPEKTVISTERHKLILNSINKLNPKLREVLILHDIEVPNVDYTDSLNREYTDIQAKDRVDVILANPPFGASVTDGVESNYPMNFRTTESADLFLILMIRYLKPTGRAAIVLPDGSLTGDGVKQRIRKHWLETCNLHTIVRLPNSVFQPYASVATNLLFFTKDEPTKEIWYWEHKLPEGVKAYNKTKPIQKAEFDSLKKWWNKRKGNDHAWKVTLADLEANGYSLDIKNPHTPEPEHSYSSTELLELLHSSFQKSDALLAKLKKELTNE